MLAALVAGIVAAFGAAVLTPFVRRGARALGAVDEPGGRRVHAVATPRMGGLAIVAAYLLAMLIVWTTGLLPPHVWDGGVSLLGFLLGGVLIAMAGGVDDLRSLGAKKKLLAQIAVASVAWGLGCRVGPEVTLPALGEVDIGLLGSYLATVCWIVGFINAINLIDGLDGLAAGIVFFAAITNIVVALVTGNVMAAVLNAALGGAVLGFLLYNWNPATIFMGDTGSMFIGYALGTAALMSGRQKESTIISLLVPMVALGLPFADTIVSMVRRFVARRSIFAADRGHIHHRLIDIGLTHRKAVLTLYACSVALSAAALAVAFGRDWQVGAAIVAAMFTLVGVLRFSGSFELALQKVTDRASLLSPPVGDLRRLVPDVIRELHSVTLVPGIWHAVERVVARGHFTRGEVVTSEGAVLWSWMLDGPAPRVEGAETEFEFPVRIFAGGPSGIVRFTIVCSDSRAHASTEILLMMMADAVEAALVRTHIQRRATLVRPTGERARTISSA